MENMSASLLALDEQDQIALRSDFLKIAAESKDDVYSEFVRELSDIIGLASQLATFFSSQRSSLHN
jgi:hypothetical protein